MMALILSYQFEPESDDETLKELVDQPESPLQARLEQDISSVIILSDYVLSL